MLHRVWFWNQKAMFRQYRAATLQRCCLNNVFPPGIPWDRAKLCSKTPLVWVGETQAGNPKECVAVFIELYRKTVTVSCVGSDFISDWTLSTAIPQPVLIRFARNKKENLSWINVGNNIKLLLRWRKGLNLISWLIFSLILQYATTPYSS